MSCSIVCERDMENWKEIDFGQEETRPDMDDSSSAGAANEGPSWANLNPDFLAEVFSHLPFEDRMRTLPLVCKGWKNASSYPACLDIRDWFQNIADKNDLWEFESESSVERLIMKVVDMSSGQLRELRAMHCSEAVVGFIADRCPLLTVSTIPNSVYTIDESIIKLAEKCPNLKELDLIECYNLSNHALEALVRHCKSLVWVNPCTFMEMPF